MFIVLSIVVLVYVCLVSCLVLICGSVLCCSGHLNCLLFNVCLTCCLGFTWVVLLGMFAIYVLAWLDWLLMYLCFDWLAVFVDVLWCWLSCVFGLLVWLVWLFAFVINDLAGAYCFVSGLLDLLFVSVCGWFVAWLLGDLIVLNCLFLFCIHLLAFNLFDRCDWFYCVIVMFGCYCLPNVSVCVWLLALGGCFGLVGCLLLE